MQTNNSGELAGQIAIPTEGKTPATIRATEISPMNEVTIGGSEIAAILGMSRYTSPHKVWRLKKGLEPKPESNYAMRRGKKVEQFIIDMYCEENGLSIATQQLYLQRGIARGSVDAIVTDESGKKIMLEIKSTLKSVDEPQIEWVLQAQWYLGLLAISGVTLDSATIVTMDGYWNIKTFEVKRDAELFEMLDSKAGEWYQKYIIENNEPPKDVEAYSKLTELSTDVKEIDNEEVSSAYLRALELKTEIKKLEDELKECEEKIKLSLGENEFAVINGSKVTWKLQTRETLDSKALQNEHPELFNKYKKVSQFRVLRY